MRDRSDYLFRNGDLSETLARNIACIKQSVADIPREQFLATSVDTLVEHLTAQLQINPLALHEDQMQMDHAESQIDVSGRLEYGVRDRGPALAPGHTLTFYVPFVGDQYLWQLKPNVWSSSSPTGSIDSPRSVLTLTLSNTANTNPSQYQKELESRLQSIRQMIAAQNQMLADYHATIPKQIRSAVESRRAEIDKLQALTATFAIPMVKKPGMPEFKPIDMPKRIVRPLPRPPAAGFKPEPAIANELYENLLAIIRHTGASFEGAPQTYSPLGEDGLRDTVLSHINVVFHGAATGETFRKYGKTDIRIEEDSRSAFVAECKLWRGETPLAEAISQLLGYLTWRDCKAALVIFNKDVAGFSTVQATVQDALKKHPKYIRDREAAYPGEWRAVFQSQEDDAREVTVHVFAFNLYVAAERAGKKR